MSIYDRIGDLHHRYSGNSVSFYGLAWRREILVPLASDELKFMGVLQYLPTNWEVGGHRY